MAAPCDDLVIVPLGAEVSSHVVPFSLRHVDVFVYFSLQFAVSLTRRSLTRRTRSTPRRRRVKPWGNQQRVRDV